MTQPRAVSDGRRFEPSVERRSNPFLFVVGSPRSGTTLLQRILNHHPLLAVANDTHFIPRCLARCTPESVEGATLGRQIPLSDQLVDSVRGYHRFHRLGLSDANATRQALHAGSYAEYVSALYTAFAAEQGKTLGGEKTPDYVRHLPLLHGLFPAARFVHIIRDGRDVALSAMDWAGERKGPGRLELWKKDPVATCALWWRWQVLTGRQSSRQLDPGSYRELNYEALVVDPEGETRRITEFLGLPFAPRMLEYHEGKRRSGRGLSAKSRWLPPTPGLRDWRTQMPERDVALFEAIAGDLLVECGYELAVSGTSGEIAGIAERSHSWWRAFLGRRAAKTRRRRGTRC